MNAMSSSRPSAPPAPPPVDPAWIELYEEIADLMPVLEKDLAVIRARNETLMPYVEEAHRRTLAVDGGLDRFVAGDPA